nr:hypothetical protein Iba_chr03aCG10790 [Ipomoea batatas]
MGEVWIPQGKAAKSFLAPVFHIQKCTKVSTRSNCKLGNNQIVYGKPIHLIPKQCGECRSR